MGGISWLKKLNKIRIAIIDGQQICREGLIGLFASDGLFKLFHFPSAIQKVNATKFLKDENFLALFFHLHSRRMTCYTPLFLLETRLLIVYQPFEPLLFLLVFKTEKADRIPKDSIDF